MHTSTLTVNEACINEAYGIELAPPPLIHVNHIKNEAYRTELVLPSLVHVNQVNKLTASLTCSEQSRTIQESIQPHICHSNHISSLGKLTVHMEKTITKL